MISVAVMGYGTVGSGVVEIIDKNKKEINEKAGDEVSSGQIHKRLQDSRR